MVALAFWQRWSVLSASPFPIGIDGYFYPIQVRSLLEHGALQYPASPLTFWFMAPFAAATDPIVGAKLGAALGTALIAMPAYGVGARLGKSRGAGLLAAALASASAGSVYLSLEFVKQGIGLTIAVAALWCVLCAIETPSRSRLAIAGAAVLAAILTHKMAAALIVIVAVPAAIEEARARGGLRGRRLIYVMLAALVTIVVALVVGAVAPQRLVTTTDLGLAGGLLSATAHWSAPALVTPHLTLAFDHEAAIGGVLALVAAILVLRGPWFAGGERVAALVIVALGLGIGLPWLAVDDPQGLGFRLRIAAFVPMALSAALVARGALAFVLGHRDRPEGARVREIILALAAAALFARGIHADRTEGQVLTHPALAAAAMAATDQIPANATVIVPERHILFMIAWYTRAPVSLKPDPIPYAHRVRIFGLAFIGANSPLDHALDAARADPSVTPPIGLHPRHRNGLVLVTEPTWDWMLAHLPPRSRSYFAAWPTI